FLQLLRANQVLDDGIRDRLDAMFRESKPLWIKIGVLRNKAFGHRSMEQTVAEVFKQADISPHDLEDFLERMQALVNLASYAWENSGHAFDHLGGKEDLIQLLTDIKRMHAG